MLLDREPLALRCALLSAASSGLHLAEGEPHDGSGTARSTEDRGGLRSSSLEPEPLEGWIRQQQQLGGLQERQQAAGGAAPGHSDGGAEVAAEAVSRTLQRVISGVERVVAGAASGSTAAAVDSIGGVVVGGAVPSACPDGAAPRPNNGVAAPSSAAAWSSSTFTALTCSVTGALRLPEFQFQGAAAIASLMEGQWLPGSSSEGHGPTGVGTSGDAEGNQASSSSVIKEDPGSLKGGRGVVRGRVFDWNHADLLGEQYDVLLACDVLYEDAAVGPIAALVPR